MKLINKKSIFIAAAALFLFILTNDVFAVSYYDVISKELNICDQEKGRIVSLEKGKITAGKGCPGCFCQFPDQSICKMEDLGNTCKQGQYKSYYSVEDANNLPDVKVGAGNISGYVTSNPGQKSFYIFDRNSDIGKTIYYYSADRLAQYFGTEWSSDNNKNFFLTALSVCNGGTVKAENIDLYYRDNNIRHWSDIDSGQCANDLIYALIDLRTNSGDHEFTVKMDGKELSKQNNVFSFYVDKNNFKYIKYYSQGDGRVSDYPYPYYVTFDNKQVDASKLEKLMPETNKLQKDNPTENIIIKIFKKIVSFFENLFK